FWPVRSGHFQSAEPVDLQVAQIDHGVRIVRALRVEPNADGYGQVSGDLAPGACTGEHLDEVRAVTADVRESADLNLAVAGQPKSVAAVAGVDGHGPRQDEIHKAVEVEVDRTGHGDDVVAVGQVGDNRVDAGEVRAALDGRVDARDGERIRPALLDVNGVVQVVAGQREDAASDRGGDGAVGIVAGFQLVERKGGASGATGDVHCHSGREKNGVGDTYW